jgi:N-acetylglucosamine-6-sulfatase
MKRSLLFYLSCLLALLWATSPPVLAQSHKPNIVFILTDDQRLDDVQYMKNLQELVIAHGATFKNYFDTVALCCPSRTSILRGQFAHNTGIETNAPPNGGFDVAHATGIENSTIATWLKKEGYKTALFGKYLNRYPGSAGPEYIPPGWDNWAVSVKGNAYSEYNYRLNENGKFVDYGQSPQDYGTDVYAQKTIQFIRNCAKEKQPFFVYFAPYAPHGPATPAARHEGMFANTHVPRSKAFNQPNVSKSPEYIQRLPLLSDEEIASEDKYHAKRLSSLQAVDEAIANIHKALSETGVLAKTYIVFTSDNGFHLGEHRLRRGKQTAYETDIHLPLFIVGPGIKAGKTIDELAGNIDLAPTFAQIGGATAPNFADGRSLMPLLSGNTPKDWRQSYLVEHWGGAGRKGQKGLRRKQQQGVSAGTATIGSAVQTSATVIEEETIEGNQPEAQQPESQNPMASSPETPRLNKNGKVRRKGMGKGESSGIPEFHALRTGDALYVQYVTGEREYYKLDSDPNEISNCAATTSAQELDPYFDRITKASKN